MINSLAIKSSVSLNRFDVSLLPLPILSADDVADDALFPMMMDDDDNDDDDLNSKLNNN